MYIFYVYPLIFQQILVHILYEDLYTYIQFYVCKYKKKNSDALSKCGVEQDVFT